MNVRTVSRIPWQRVIFSETDRQSVGDLSIEPMLEPSLTEREDLGVRTDEPGTSTHWLSKNFAGDPHDVRIVQLVEITPTSVLVHPPRLDTFALGLLLTDGGLVDEATADFVATRLTIGRHELRSLMDVSKHIVGRDASR